MIRIDGNMVYVNETAVAVIMDMAPAEAKAEFAKQMKRLGILDHLDDAKTTVRAIAGSVTELAKQMQVDGEAANIEDLIG